MYIIGTRGTKTHLQSVQKKKIVIRIHLLTYLIMIRIQALYLYQTYNIFESWSWECNGVKNSRGRTLSPL